MTSYLHDVSSFLYTTSNNVIKAPFPQTACVNKNKGTHLSGWLFSEPEVSALHVNLQWTSDYFYPLSFGRAHPAKPYIAVSCVYSPWNHSNQNHLLTCKCHLEGLNFLILPLFNNKTVTSISSWQGKRAQVERKDSSKAGLTNNAEDGQSQIRYQNEGLWDLLLMDGIW